ncbi:MAG TPA: DUF3037 domain-containing protein [Candidatus Acidoferrum sp.]
MNKREDETQANNAPAGERAFAYRILRYTPNLVRDEWVNIGVLLFAPETGERRLKLIEEQDELNRVRRLHPQADESLLLRLRDDLEDRLQLVNGKSGNGHDWQALLAKWDDTLSNAVQLSPQKGTLAQDLDAEMKRLYDDHVAVRRGPARIGATNTRSQMRSYCEQVFRQAGLWDRMQQRVRVSEFTFPGDPMRMDYAYRRNGTRGFVHTLPVRRAPGETKNLAYTAGRISSKAPWKSEFAAVTDVELSDGIPLHRFVRDTLRDAGIEPVPLDHFAVWVAKLRPMIQ